MSSKKKAPAKKKAKTEKKDDYDEGSSSYEYEGHESKVPDTPSPAPDFTTSHQPPTTQAGTFHQGVVFDITALDSSELTTAEQRKIRSKQYNRSIRDTEKGQAQRENRGKTNPDTIAQSTTKRRQKRAAMSEEELEAYHAERTQQERERIAAMSEEEKREFRDKKNELARERRKATTAARNTQRGGSMQVPAPARQADQQYLFTNLPPTSTINTNRRLEGLAAWAPDAIAQRPQPQAGSYRGQTTYYGERDDESVSALDASMQRTYITQPADQAAIPATASVPGFGQNDSTQYSNYPEQAQAGSSTEYYSPQGGQYYTQEEYDYSQGRQ
jgi:hypothetical protein